MIQKVTLVLFFTTFFISCSSNKKGVVYQDVVTDTHSIKGSVTATEYKIPLPCSIEIYDKEKIFSTTSNRQGKFSFRLEAENIKKSLYACITPLENSVLKDTSFLDYYEVGAECMFHNPNKDFITDTIYFSISEASKSLDWNIKGCVAYPYGKVDEE